MKSTVEKGKENKQDKIPGVIHSYIKAQCRINFLLLRNIYDAYIPTNGLPVFDIQIVQSALLCGCIVKRGY